MYKHCNDSISSHNVSDFSNLNITLTKRLVLRKVSGVYDPLAMGVPHVLTAKAWMRTLCKESANSCKDWDRFLSLEHRDEYRVNSLKVSLF